MNSAWHGNEDIMAEKVDYGTLKKGGFMRQKQKNNFSLRLAVVGGYLTAENLTKIAEVAEKYGCAIIRFEEEGVVMYSYPIGAGDRLSLIHI